MPDRFIFNDERQENSYGFSIRTDGIDLSRFKKNPVMLNDHWNSTAHVLGKWTDIQKKAGKLSGVPEFDPEDEEAQKIAGKVERGYLKTCSMGIRFKREDMQLIGGKPVLLNCELMEVSIVAIPSNANSVRLFVDDSEEPMTDEQIQALTLSLQSTPETNFKPDNEMKVTLTQPAMLALGFDATAEPEVAELSQKVIDLNAKLKAKELQLNQFIQKQEEEKLARIKLMVANAKKAGKITAEKEEEWVNLGIANEALLKETLDNLPAKASLSATISNSGEKEVKSVDDFQKLSIEEQLAFKAEQPEAYKKLFDPKK